MKNETLKWRLGKLPTVEELLDLVKNKIISQEEAKEILFSTETKEDRDVESLKAEIKFLRELVDRLSKNQTTIVETIKYVEKPYYKWEWYKPYATWQNDIVMCNAAADSGSYLAVNNAVSCNFKDIQTF